MRDVLDDIERLQARGRRVALARVVEVKGSGPRDPGAAMVVSEDGEVAGSVSGGCVEGAVVAEALEVLATGVPRLCTFGYSDDEAFSVGLTCGGTIRVFVEPLETVVMLASLAESLRAGEIAALATVIEVITRGPADHVSPAVGAKILVHAGRAGRGSLGDPDLDAAVIRDASGAMEADRNVILGYGEHGEPGRSAVLVFVETFVAPDRMVILGAVDFTAALVKVAKILGYRVTVCDARPSFATSERFPEADDLVVDWPHRYLATVEPPLGPRDALCVLTHDHKFDVPAIAAALRSRVGYVGAMGSRRTHAERVERLRAEGVSEDQLGRLMAPIGIDLGARTPEETAVSICAEIIALRTGTPAASLRHGSGPIHRAPSVSGAGV